MSFAVVQFFSRGRIVDNHTWADRPNWFLLKDIRETIKARSRHMPSDVVNYQQQTGAGKGDAARLGFARSEGEMLMILDADLTVPPEDLPRFYKYRAVFLCWVLRPVGVSGCGDS
jgi:Glycosyl transferase family 2